MDLEKLKTRLTAAHIAFAGRNVGNPPRNSLYIHSSGYSLSITPSVYHYGARYEFRPGSGPKIAFSSGCDPAGIVGGMDLLVHVARLVPRISWATKQLALITGRYPGSPVLVYEPSSEKLEIIPRPASFNQLHKFAAIKTFQLDANPKIIARDLDRLRQQSEPQRSWSNFVDDWNRKYSARFGRELALSASYIYAWNGFRFLLDGNDLGLDVWQPVAVSDFAEAIRLLESVEDIMKQAKECGIPASGKPYQTKSA